MKLPIIERDGRFILQKTFEISGEKKQRQIPLGSVKKTAEVRATRFLACYEVNGFQVALDDLNGKSTIKKGDDLTYEQIESLYKEFLNQCNKQPREISTNQSLQALKRIMNGKTLAKVDMQEVRGRILKDPKNPSNVNSFNSYCRNARAIFKAKAMIYYQKQKKTVINPFKDFEIESMTIEPYTPFSKEILDKLQTRKKNLSPQEQLIINLCLYLALRKSEATAMRVSWWSVQEDKALLSIQRDADYIPKNSEKRIIPVTLKIYEELMELRNQCLAQDPEYADSPYFIPVESRQGKPATRLHRKFAAVNEFLKGLGITERKAVHGLRKYGGSVICANTTLLEASRILGHSNPQITAKHYASVLDYTPINGIEIENKNKTPEQTFAESLGITVEELRKKLKD